MKKYSLPFLLTFLFIPDLLAVDFTAKEKSIIYTNAIEVLQNYQTIINLMGESVVTDIEKAKSGEEGFLELFVNRQVLIYNDLDPAHKLSEFYEAETYANSLLLWYPDGINVSLDLANARVSEIMTHSENVYSLDILVKKSINGNYFNQTLNKNIEELTFRIAFNLENKSLGKFRIVGIRSASSSSAIDFTQALKEVDSEDFNADDLAKVHSEIKTVLKDYAMFLNLIGDPQETAEDKESYKVSFFKLFPGNDTRIYNDISPEAQTNLVSVTDYLNSYIADYPKGVNNLSINPDSAKFGQVMKSDSGGYYTYTNVNKFFSGSYKGKDAYSNMFPLIFKISFNAVEKTFSDFRISGIDKSEVNFYAATQGTAEVSKPEIIIRPVSRKGFGMSLTGSFGITSINDKDIKSLTDAKNLHSWDVAPLFGFISAIGVSYYFNDNIAVKSGIEYNKYSTRFRLSGNFTDNVLSADVNSDTYYRKVEAIYDSIVSINYITFPLLANYTSGKPGKFGFYAEGGIKISIPQKATFRDTGYYKFYGYYPTEVPVYQIKEGNGWNILGFYTRDPIDYTDEIKINEFNLALYASAGINIPLGYYSSITIGPEAIIGISDIVSYKKTYSDIFGKSYTHQPTRIRNFGLRISLAYKL